MAVFEPSGPFIAWPRMVAFGSEAGRSTAENSVASDIEDALSAFKGKLAAQQSSCKDPGQPRAALRQDVRIDRHVGVDVQGGQALGIDVEPAGNAAVSPARAGIHAVATVTEHRQDIGVRYI